MALDAIIFDVDGTLVDTNYHHVCAWRRAFAELGYEVPEDRISPEIGKGGDKLVPAILGPSAEAMDGESVRAAYGRHFLDIAASTKFAAFPGAVLLIESAKHSGLNTAIATSAEEEYLKAIEASSGVAWSQLVDHVITGSDAKRSKPSPTLILAATAGMGLTPAQCAMVGDTPHDARSCRASGVAYLGVQTGGYQENDLLGAGARMVWRDAMALNTEFKAACDVASPGPTHWSKRLLEKLMSEALQCASEGMSAGEAPIGCVLAKGNGSDTYEVVARGFNSMNSTQDKTAHAEMVAFAQAAGKVSLDAKNLVMASTLEPCVMCFGAAAEAAVDLVVYALSAPFDSGTNRVIAPTSPESRMPRVVGPVLEIESRKLFDYWLSKNRHSSQSAYVKQLLGFAA